MTVMLMLMVAPGLGFASVVLAAERATVPQAFPSESTRALGLPKAPVTMVELSDFQCSFCRKFWVETLPRLKETYIKNGQVRFAYQHFALLGEHSFAAAQAAECAREQKKFWPYHDKLFESQGGLAFTNAKLKRYAHQSGLDMRAFARCLDSGKYQQQVEDETKLGLELGARGTPTFLINGQMLVGARPFQVFQAAIEEALANAATQNPRKPPPTRLASADERTKMNFEVSPSGYGIHWAELDEDLSIDGMIRAAKVRKAG